MTEANSIKNPRATSHIAKTTPSATTAALKPTGSGHQLYGEKKPRSPAKYATSAWRSSYGLGSIRREVKSMNAPIRNPTPPLSTSAVVPAGSLDRIQYAVALI